MKNRVRTISIVVTPYRGRPVTKTLTLRLLDDQQRLVFETMGCMILELKKAGWKG